jgi:hypothetical protein
MFHVQYFHGTGQPLGEPTRFEAPSLQAAVAQHCDGLMREGRKADLRVMLWEAKPVPQKLMFFRNTRSLSPHIPSDCPPPYL